MTTTQHRCTQTGEKVELEARYDPDAEFYVLYHSECNATPCVSYKEAL